MGNGRDLVLTGWGYAEYVASAAVALKALGGRADVYGVSRRRLPELLSELASERGASSQARYLCPGRCSRRCAAAAVWLGSEEPGQLLLIKSQLWFLSGEPLSKGTDTKLRGLAHFLH